MTLKSQTRAKDLPDYNSHCLADPTITARPNAEEAENPYKE
jgi:hypothetical protein